VTEPLLTIEGLEVAFRVAGRRQLHAVSGVDLTVAPGEVVALVGESGSGKTTLGRCVLGLQTPTAGAVRVAGAASEADVHRLVQPVFQDPYSSLDPRWAARRTIREALDAQRIGTPAEREQRVDQLLAQVGLQLELGGRRPRELSGGQRQRVAIAAALAPGPKLIVADEPVSALDMLVQAQILNLIDRLREELELAILFITHDLAVVRHLADRVAVMYLGRIVEQGTVGEVFSEPRHPYTRALLEAHPPADPSRPFAPPRLPGEIPDPTDPPSGCAFHPRCPLAIERCRIERPEHTPFGGLQSAACHVAAAASAPAAHQTATH
jgi:peptide/nickel transport system ATP-binding protein